MSNGKTYVVLEPTYPHDFLRHLNRLVNGKKSVLRDKEQMLSDFRQRYPGNEYELSLLELSYESDLVSEFLDNDVRESWRKRIFLETALKTLVTVMTECEVVMLLESFMFVMNWDFSLSIERKWNAPEEEWARFHEKTDLDSGTPVAEPYSKKEKVRRKRPIRPSIEVMADQAANVEELFPDEDYQIRQNTPVQKPKRKHTKPAKPAKPERERRQRRIEREYYDDYEDDYYDDYEEESPLKQLPEQVKFFRLMTLNNQRTLRRAFRGDAMSQCEIGDFYTDGEHRDYREAIKWYTISAEGGYERAFLEMGKVYDLDIPEIPNGKKKAMKIYLKLANQGYPTAQCILGRKYWFGDGVEVDLKQAVKWLHKAAEQKLEEAVRNLADLYASVGDTENANKWYKIGASAGDVYCKRRVR